MNSTNNPAYSILKNKPFFVLAPMDDVTETAFRQIVDSTAAPDLNFTEFVNVDGLMSPGRSKLMKKLKFVASEKRLVAQLWGLKPENFRAIAAQIADGTIAREPALIEGTASQLGPALGESAKRALLQCQPYTMLRPDTYDTWKDMEIKFDPIEMFG